MSYYCRTCPRIIEEDDIDQCPECRDSGTTIEFERMKQQKSDIMNRQTTELIRVWLRANNTTLTRLIESKDIPAIETLCLNVSYNALMAQAGRR